MPRYKKKIPTIDAKQFDEGQEPLPEGVIELAPSSYWLVAAGYSYYIGPASPGGQPIESGDWIVEYPDGTRFCCTPEEFTKTFELE